MSSNYPRWGRYGHVGWLLLALTVPVTAEPVYKSVDESGNVTYSSSPQSGAAQTQSVPVPPPPSKDQRREAQAVERRLQGTSKSVTRGLEKRKLKSSNRVREAEEKLNSARSELEKAQVKKDEDWQNLAQGGRHLKESYFQRVSAAEAAVQAAEQELAKARRDMR